MSQSHEHGPAGGHAHDHGVRSEEDRISTAPVVAVGVASLVIFFIASFVTVRYWADTRATNGPFRIPAEVGDSKIGMVEQQLFNGGPLRGERQRDRKLQRLGSSGWVDQGAGVAHLPIEEAMSLVVRGVRPMPAPQPDVHQTPPVGGQP